MVKEKAMVATNPVNFNDNNVNLVKTSSFKIDPAGTAFNSELLTALKGGENTAETKGEESKKLVQSKNLLDYLKASSFNLKFSDSEINTASASLGTTPEALKNVLNDLRTNLMSGIKKSLLKLEQAVNDPANKVPSELVSKFNAGIDSIKQDFTEGFGEDFDSFEPVETKPDESLLKELYSHQNDLPKSIADKLAVMFE